MALTKGFKKFALTATIAAAIGGGVYGYSKKASKPVATEAPAAEVQAPATPAAKVEAPAPVQNQTAAPVAKHAKVAHAAKPTHKPVHKASTKHADTPVYHAPAHDEKTAEQNALEALSKKGL